MICFSRQYRENWENYHHVFIALSLLKYLYELLTSISALKVGDFGLQEGVSKEALEICYICFSCGGLLFYVFITLFMCVCDVRHDQNIRLYYAVICLMQLMNFGLLVLNSIYYHLLDNITEISIISLALAMDVGLMGSWFHTLHNLHGFKIQEEPVYLQC